MIEGMNGSGKSEVDPLLNKIAMGQISRQAMDFVADLCDKELKKNDLKASKLFKDDAMDERMALQLAIERDVLKSLHRRITKIFQESTGG